MVTMRDIAREAGVSQATVSYVLHNDPSISKPTRDKVLRVAQRLNYSINVSARTLRSGRTNAIGLVLQDLHNPYSTQVADAISVYARRRGYQTIIQQTFYEGDAEAEILQHIVSSMCDGVIFSPSKLNVREIMAQLNGKPSVLLSPVCENHSYDTMLVACEQGIFTTTSYLLSRGCRRPLFYCSRYADFDDIRDSADSKWQRVAGFQRALLRNGITPEPWQFLPERHWNRRSARETIVEAVRTGLDFDSVVCINDESAIGVLRGLADCGVRVPQDVSVVGFDGIEEGECCVPSLTTFAMDFDDFARKAVDALIDRINGDDAAPHAIIANSRLVVRESTR
ncbi:LacI family DNA-binding transcriptional regulator [Bifidobacterium sp. MA2]|uniref:LacI family DNA-binding transcriptional regulator n=1 Tax=Bifidobacterium santillanense TaxID=2809028 RepID=A0ABS5UPE2_9BIFI|nr:LacI family DNA-binding transcriptional regulator [Bifidobacterium santillanense]MBT1172782.1 LacI family DNA-binding transcriptional regulator [Bifidobacterium santillanense]